MPGIENPLVLGPILVPLSGAAICLLMARQNRLQRIIGLIAGIIGCLCSLAVLAANFTDASASIQIYRLGGWESPFGIVLVADRLAALLSFMGSFVIAAGLLYCLQCHDTSL